MPVLYGIGIQPPSHMPRRGHGGGGGGGQGRAKRASTHVIVIDDDEAPRQAPFLGPAAAETATLRAEARASRLALKHNLKTAKVLRQAVTEGQTQDTAMELARDTERAALELLDLVLNYAGCFACFNRASTKGRGRRRRTTTRSRKEEEEFFNHY